MVEYKALKDIATIVMGQSPDSSSYNEEKNGIPFYQGNADFGELYPTARVWCSKPKKIAKENDILISVRAPIGALNYAAEECCIGRGLAAITIEDDFERNYVFHFLKAQNKELNNKGTGSTFKAISKSVLEDLQVPIIGKKEQEIIMNMMDIIEEIIRQRKQELQKYEDLIKARFVEIFGDLANPDCSWNKCQLVDACKEEDDIKCGPFGTQLSKDEYKKSGIAVWEIPQINTAFMTEPTHYLTEEKAKQLRAYTIIPGDIAMSRKGNVGKCALFPETYSDGIIHSDVLRIRVNKRIVNPVFMMYQLHFSGAVTRQIELVSSGAIMAGVNVTKLKRIYVHIPPIKLQDEFADFVAQVDKSKVAIQAALDKTQLLFDSLMQEYFG